MNSPSHLLVFSLDEQRYALHLPVVDRVVQIVEVTPVPRAPEIVLGVVNVRGRITCVLNIRKRFRLPERETSLSNQLILAHTSKRSVALVVDNVSGLVEHSPQEVIAAEKIVPRMEYVEGAVKLEGGVILIHDLDRFLSLEEERVLDDALKKRKKEEHQKGE